MSYLRVSLFGRVKVTKDSWKNEIKLTRTIQLLLAYLLLERGRLHPREVVADLFWSNYDPVRARNCFNTALWRLRRAIEPESGSPGTYVITSHTGEVGFNRECEYWLDVADFENHVGGILKEPVDQVNAVEIGKLENGLELYQGDLLESVYQDWALRAREQKRMLYLDGLAYLMRYYQHRRDFTKSLGCGNRILSMDPLREEIHREMMKLYVARGERPLAVRQFETCRQQLSDEFGIAPMRETQVLYDQIISGSEIQLSFKIHKPSNIGQAVRQLKQASENFDQARNQLNQAIHTLHEISSDVLPEE